MTALTSARVVRVFRVCRGSPLRYARASERISRLAEAHEHRAIELGALANALDEQAQLEVARRLDTPNALAHHTQRRNHWLRRIGGGA